jgi:hypothetical protein
MPMVYDRRSAIGPAFESKKPDRATFCRLLELPIGILTPYSRANYGLPDRHPSRRHCPIGILTLHSI